MGEFTLEDIGTWIGFFAALIGSCAGIYAWIKKLLKSLFDAQTKGLNEQIKNVDLENCINFIVSFLARVERGEPVDEIEKQRFWDQYEHYSSNGGNSYIANKVEKEKATGRL